jgi:hypothetical protein
MSPSFVDFDYDCGISALTNRGGFPDVFAGSELSRVG